MPQNTWSAKRERQYGHIKESLIEHGKPESLAEEIAARVVNKERAQHGESVTASPSSINDMSSSRRGGLHSHKGSGGRILLQLHNEARQRSAWRGFAAMRADTSDTAGTEIPQAATTEARAVAPALISSIEAVARSRLLTVGVDTLLAEVAALLSDSQISLVVVCDVSWAAVGAITESILVRQLGFAQASVFTTRAGEVMAREFTVCMPTDPLSEVLAVMHNRGLLHVLVVDASRKPLGVVNARDGLRALLAAGNHEEALLRNYVMSIGYQWGRFDDHHAG